MITSVPTAAQLNRIETFVYEGKRNLKRQGLIDLSTPDWVLPIVPVVKVC